MSERGTKYRSGREKVPKQLSISDTAGYGGILGCTFARILGSHVIKTAEHRKIQNGGAQRFDQKHLCPEHPCHGSREGLLLHFYRPTIACLADRAPQLSQMKGHVPQHSIGGQYAYILEFCIFRYKCLTHMGHQSVCIGLSLYLFLKSRMLELLNLLQLLPRKSRGYSYRTRLRQGTSHAPLGRLPKPDRSTAKRDANTKRYVFGKLSLDETSL